jgi:AcrR family transcriptional regulator
MTSSEPTDIRERIIQEATSLFVARGYHGISMREIAEAVGISKAGLYYHFRDKETLFLTILTANLKRVGSVISDARSAGVTTRDQISRMVQAILEQEPDQRAIIRLASQEMEHLSQEARAEFDFLYREKFISQVDNILQAGVAGGELRAIDVGLSTWVLLGMMYPFFYPAHERELGSADEAIELMLIIFFDGAAAKDA